MENAEPSPSTTGVNEASAIAVASRTERLISWLTLILGGATAVIVGALHHPAWAEGLAIGAALAWLNFRWLKRGLEIGRAHV